MKSQYTSKKNIELVKMLLTKENRLAIEVSERYGLRISDVLRFKTADLNKVTFGIKEQKTGKIRRIKLNPTLRRELVMICGSIFVWENNRDGRRHRTRQAVWADLRRAKTALRIKENITPHSARKIFAVNLYNKSGDMEKVKKILNHTSDAVTMIYALADKM